MTTESRNIDALAKHLSNVSHEIRTPMNGILGMVELLNDSPLNADQRTYLEVIRTNSQSLCALINDVLDFSGIAAGELELVPEPFDLARTVREIVGLFRPLAREKNIAFDAVVDASIPPVVIGDRARIARVFSHLVGNGVKFTERGGVSVRLEVESRGAETVTVRCQVTDTGIGIAPEVQALLFQPFAQGDASSTRKYGGAGLGLALSRHLVGMMGGVMGCDSTPGKGSTFWWSVRFPLPDAATSRSFLAEQAEDATSREDAVRKNLEVLIVEDNESNQIVARMMLERFGCRSDVAGNGEEGLVALAERAYDLVFMDCQMPVMDGFEATRLLRKVEGKGKHIPVIACTASPLKGERERCAAAGMDDILAKPITFHSLSAILRKWGGAGAGRGAPAPEEQPADRREPIDSSRIAHLRGLSERSDPALFGTLVRSFLRDAPERISLLRDAFAHSDCDGVFGASHALKGISANIGARQMAETADRLQVLAHGGDLHGAGALIGEIERDFARARLYLESEFLHGRREG